MRTTLISLCAQILVFGLALADEPIGIQSSATPPVAKACAIAYTAFSRELAQRNENTNDFGVFMSNIDNYQIRIYSEAGAIFVEFAPKPFEGALIRGGVTKYEIDIAGERIVHIKRYR